MRFIFTLLTAVFLGNMAAAATVGDDGLHIQPWIRDTFKDLQEDLDEANAEGKRLGYICLNSEAAFIAKRCMKQSILILSWLRLHR